MAKLQVEPEMHCTFNGCPTGRLSDNHQQARAAGWHIWSGYTHGGAWEEVILCPQHAGNHKRETVGRPEWDEPLF